MYAVNYVDYHFLEMPKNSEWRILFFLLENISFKMNNHSNQKSWNRYISIKFNFMTACACTHTPTPLRTWEIEELFVSIRFGRNDIQFYILIPYPPIVIQWSEGKREREKKVCDMKFFAHHRTISIVDWKIFIIVYGTYVDNKIHHE